MPLPWISRGHHADVLRVQQDLIDHLKGQIKVLEERLSQPVTVNATVTLPEDFAVIHPAYVRGRRQKPQDENETPAPEIKWEDLNENDHAKIAEIAARELPPGANKFIVGQTVARIIKNIRMAKVARATRALTTGSVGTVAPAAAAQASVIPEEVRERIAAAERGE